MNTSRLNIIDENGSITIDITNLGIATIQKGGKWTVYCPSLKILGFSSKNRNAAFEDFKENLVVFFNYHIKSETLERALLKLQWKDSSLKSLIPPSYKPEFQVDFNEPALEPTDFKFGIAA